MILKASERGDASQLARYLLALRENEHVELHDVRGFCERRSAGGVLRGGRHCEGAALQEPPVLDEPQPDRSEKDGLIFRQLEERQALQRDVRAQRSMAQEDLLRLREDIEHYRNLDARDHNRLHERERERDNETGTCKHTRARRQRLRRGFEP